MVQTFNGEESVQEFDNHFVREGPFTGLNDFRHDVDEMHEGTPTEDNALAMIAKAEEVIKLCKQNNV